jgi:hypothetical protein
MRRTFLAMTFVLPLLLGAGLASCTPPPPPDPWQVAVGQCWGPQQGQPFVDIEYLGPKNTFQNALSFGSTDATCDPLGGAFTQTIVAAADAAGAQAICTTLGAEPGVPLQLNHYWLGSTIPSDAWGCD